MGIRQDQYNDILISKVDSLGTSSPVEIARILPLYIKILNDKGVVNNVSYAYIENYDGKSFYKRFKKRIDGIYEMFLRNGLDDKDRKSIFKNIAYRTCKIPQTISDFNRMNSILIDETRKRLKNKKTYELRKNLVDKFKFAIKKYLHLTYVLGYNEPSTCVIDLIRSHKIDKYIMSGDFSVLLLPFLPDVENEIKNSYENYHMKDSWEMLKGRYFNHKEQFDVLAIEIKSAFNKVVSNFSNYIDKMYTDTYYKLMLGKGIGR